MGNSTKPILIGLCGRSGAGKGYVARLFAEVGIPSIDTDAVYRELTAAGDTMSPCMRELCDRFGDAVCNPDGSLNRGALRALVFGEENRENLADLNRITHRHIFEETKARAEALCGAGFTHILIDAPVLFESGFDRMCAAVVCVTAPEETHIRRIMERDGIDRAAAELRLGSQLTEASLTARADIVIANDTDKDTLRCRVRAAAGQLKEIKGIWD